MSLDWAMSKAKDLESHCGQVQQSKVGPLSLCLFLDTPRFQKETAQGLSNLRLQGLCLLWSCQFVRCRQGTVKYRGWQPLSPLGWPGSLSIALRAAVMLISKTRLTREGRVYRSLSHQTQEGIILVCVPSHTRACSVSMLRCTHACGG